MFWDIYNGLRLSNLISMISDSEFQILMTLKLLDQKNFEALTIGELGKWEK